MLTLIQSRFLLAALLFVWLGGPMERTNAQALESLQHQSWSTEAGLPQSSVHQILQSRDGYLWLATEGGAVRYDGVSFKVFGHETQPSFTSNDVSSLAQDRDGNLWFGTADGLIRYEHGHLQRFGEADSMGSSSILSLAAASDGSLYVLTGAGIVRFDGSHFSTVEGLPANVSRLQQGSDGSVILGTGKGLLRLADGRLGPLWQFASVSQSLLDGAEFGSDGTAWAWSDHEVSASVRDRHYVWKTGRELPGTRVQTLFVDKQGTAWVGTNRGLVTVTPFSQHPNVISPLGVNSILSAMQDAEGNIWVGTETSGLHTLRPRKFREEPALADEEVSCVVQASDGSVWIGTRDDGLRRRRSGSSVSDVERPVPNAALTSPVILSLAPGLQGDIWAGTPDGLNYVEASGKTTRYTSSDGLPDDLIRSVLVGHDGTVWAGTRHGLARVHAGRVQALTQSDGLGSDFIGVMFEAERQGAAGELWIGTLSGLSVLRGSAFTNFSRADGLPSNLVSGLAEDGSGRLWVSTRDAGLLLFDGQKFHALAAKGLPQEIFSVTADSHGFLWLRGRHGVTGASAYALAVCALESKCDVNAGVYGVEDRMPSEEIVANGDPSAWRMTNGEIWFASRKGVGIVSPATLSLNNVAPPVVIESFSADGENIPLDSSVPEIPSGHARYTFDYAGLSYTVPSKVLYRSKLEGFDRDWTGATNRRNVSYTNLPPGRYTFRVQAANNDGLWNDAGAVVHFRILPPFYRRWWFLLTLVLVFAGLVALLYRLRVRRLQLGFDAVLAERSRIAREIHDTLAQDLVGVSLQLDLVSQLLARDNVQAAIGQLKLTRTLVKEGLEEARQSIWNLRANSARDSLPSRVSALGKRFGNGDVVLKTKIGGAYRVLPGAIEEEVIRILQEAVSNVERHAGAASVGVQLMYGQDKLVVTVNDDGRGFSPADASSKTGHFGLQGMRERATSIQSALEVRSTPGEGTVVELVVPITGKKG
jgi:signal transduction histidine kinase/ligand-binding sensor domain-containing protein